MSSHHIVREKQEPALLVLGLESIDDEQIGQLLEWSPTVFASPLMAEKLNAQGIKVDWLVGGEEDPHLQSDIKHLPADHQHLLQAALNYLILAGYPAVNIVIDEFNLSDYLPFADQINLVILSGQQKIYAVSSGFSKWKPAGQAISLLSNADSLVHTGLQPAGIQRFVTVADGFFSLQFKEPFLFISEFL